MRLVLCNCPAKVAEEIGWMVLEKHLGVCVNSVPGVQRTFRRDGKVCVQEETMLLIQTDESILKELIKAIVELHPSELPAIISLQVIEGYDPYIEWVEKTLPVDTDSGDGDAEDDGLPPI